MESKWVDGEKLYWVQWKIMMVALYPPRPTVRHNASDLTRTNGDDGLNFRLVILDHRIDFLHRPAEDQLRFGKVVFRRDELVLVTAL